MCLAIPAKVVEVMGDSAVVDLMGNTQEANLSLVEGVGVGDYVLLHAGFAIERLDEDEAAETLKAFEEYHQVLDEDTPDGQ